MEYIMKNIQWIFSGIGVFFISIIFYFLFQKNKKIDNKTINIKNKGSSNKFDIEQK